LIIAFYPYILQCRKEPEKKEIDDNDYEALDQETMRQRAWDAYKDGMYSQQSILLNH
jgi:hypothetical protein